MIRQQRSDTEAENADPNGRWEHFKSNIINAAEQPNKQLDIKPVTKYENPAYTDKMIDMMEERKKWKSIHSQEGRKNINH